MSTAPTQFRRLLVANRGEIAIRIFRAATELGLETVAVYSHADRLALHRYKADEAWQIGDADDPYKAYLDGDAILEVAKERGVDAIHPGYGFLSENADFARKCAAAGIVFIGPPPEAIDRLGDKVAARALAVEAGVNVVPGTKDPVETVEDALAFAKDAGYPLMVKAAHGGGGRGMRRCNDDDELRESFDAAKREAQVAFGRGEVFLERFIERPRHIEVQVLGDREGNLVHLFERDCSVQRRHQKVVEVAPAVGLTDAQRDDLYAAALKVAKTAGLSNAATVEFLVDDKGYYFIEVNPRLQVEHTITELITGIDIVQSQIHLAEGHLLASEKVGIPSQESIERRGCAIQARVTTEDPTNNFAPDTGVVTAYRSAAGFGIRLDVSIAGAGAEITPYYDSLLVKVSAFALTHQEASKKLGRSLTEFRIRGVRTNIPFIENIIRDEAFLKGQLDTGLIERNPKLFEFPHRRNRASRVLYALADTTVNGPAGLDTHLEKPKVTIVPPRLGPTAVTFDQERPKDILDAKGPEAVAAWAREQKRLLLTDTTFRDAHQSLLATRVRTHDMAKVAAATEARLPGAFSIECWGGATFDVAYRFLREDPWERLATLRKKMPHTLLQMLLRGSNAVGYTNYPQNVIRRFVDLAAKTGIDVFRIFDCFNQLDAMQTSIDSVREAGKIAEVCLCFTGDPLDKERTLYTFDYYVRKATEAQAAGAHIIAIKDMAGLLKPHAARELIKRLRAAVDLPLHLHTHDTSGNGVATLLAATDGGVDIVDGALASMSGLTSQPSLDAVVAALSGTERDCEVDPVAMQELSDYWEAVRTWYAPFESGLKASTGDVYRHEIPGGQYSNLKPQAFAVGLADQWAQVRDRYREVNLAFGDIIKVTPSSKVVGDFALWLVRNNLTVEQLLQSDAHYDLPQSVTGYFQGSIGIPEPGFPEGLRKRVLGADAPPAPTKFASSTMDDYDFAEKRKDLERLAPDLVSDTLEVSYALYPQVVKDYLEFRTLHWDTSVLDTETFFYGLEIGREVFVDIEPGKTLVIELRAIGDLSDDNTRTVYFMLNGQPRSVEIPDRHVVGAAAARRKANRDNPAEVGAPMPGTILSLAVKVGDVVEAEDPLGVVEAMKLETPLRAPVAGTIAEVVVAPKDKVEAQDLLLVITPKDA